MNTGMKCLGGAMASLGIQFMYLNLLGASNTPNFLISFLLTIGLIWLSLDWN